MRVLVLVAIIIFLCGSAVAEDTYYGWIMCQPGSFVNIRMFPNKHSESVGIAESGVKMEFTGARRGKWVECIYPEGKGWIRSDYVSFRDAIAIPEGLECETTVGGLAVRFSINGKVKERLRKEGTKVRVFIWTVEWCVTDRGFIMTKYLRHE